MYSHYYDLLSCTGKYLSLTSLYYIKIIPSSTPTFMECYSLRRIQNGVSKVLEDYLSFSRKIEICKRVVCISIKE